MNTLQSQKPFSIATATTSSLLGQVLVITGVAFLITAAAAYLFRDIAPGVGLIAFFAGLAVLIGMSFARKNSALSLALFYAFALLEGIGLAPTIAAYVIAVGSGPVVNAAATTGMGMLALAAIVAATSFDFRRLSGIAMIALLALVVIGVISLFVRFVSPTLYSWATLGVFTVLVLVDFGRIRAGGDGLTAVELATSIYLDALNIFIALLQIFGGRRRSN